MFENHFRTFKKKYIFLQSCAIKYLRHMIEFMNLYLTFNTYESIPIIKKYETL